MVPYAHINGVKLYYEIRGTGFPVLFLCGTGLDHKSWQPILPFFEKDYQCVLYDNRGIGRSDSPEEGYEIEMMAKDAAALLRHLEIKSAVLAGWSVGTVIAIEMTYRFPELVAGLLLYCTCDRMYPHMRRRINVQIELAKLNQKNLLAAYSVLNLFSPQFINEHEDVVQTFQSDVLESPSRPEPANLVKHYEVSFRYFARASDARFSAIRVPSLIAVGSEDPLTRPEYNRAVHERISGSEFVVMPGADHTMPVFRAQELATISLDFLRRHAIKAEISA